jgi:hypothetical protein
VQTILWSQPVCFPQGTLLGPIALSSILCAVVSQVGIFSFVYPHHKQKQKENKKAQDYNQMVTCLLLSMFFQIIT